MQIIKEDSLSEINQFKIVVKKLQKKSKKKEKKNSEEMSLPGIGNAKAGTALFDVAKNLFTPEHNKPATKGDFIKPCKSFK